MGRIIRFAVMAGISLVLLLAAAAAVATFVIDPNDYKPQLEKIAEDATGKKLHLEGKLSLSVFPKIRIQAGPTFMRDDPSFGPEPFLQVESIRASVALLPLLRGDVAIDNVEIIGARLKLAVNEKGVNNWSTPAGTEKTPPKNEKAPDGNGTLPPVSLDALLISDALIAYTDIPAKKNVTLAIKQFDLANVKVGEKSVLNLDALIAGVLTEPAAFTLASSFTLPRTLAEGTAITAEGRFADFPFSFKGFVASDNGLTLKGDASLGAVDLDKLLAAPAGEGRKSEKTTQPGAASATDEKALAETLRGLSLDLRVKAQSVTVAKIPLKNIDAAVKGDKGLITVSPVSLDVFGPVTAEARMDARGNAVASALSGKWRNAALGPLVTALTGKPSLTGALDADWNVTATGLSRPSIMKTLGGTASFSMRDGTLPAFRLVPPGLPGLPATTLDITGIAASSAWRIANGVASNNDLAVKASVLTASGEGKVSLPEEWVDFALDVKLSSSGILPNLTVLPVTVSGPLSSPSYSVNETAVLKRAAQNVLKNSAKLGKGTEKERVNPIRGFFRK